MKYIIKRQNILLIFSVIIAILTATNTFKIAQSTELVESLEPIIVTAVSCDVHTEDETQSKDEPDPKVTQVQKEEASESKVIDEKPAEVLVPKKISPRIDCPLDDSTQQMIVDKCEKYGVDFAFVMGLMYNESRFQPDVISPTNDYGLMQINIINHEWLSETLGITDFLDPEQNVTAGLYILGQFFEKYEDPRLVLMAYGYGESGAKKLWDKGIYTSDHAERVLSYVKEFEEEIKNNTY